MTERPILFSGPMVRAILAGTKTQTRRVVKGRGWEPHHMPHCRIVQHTDERLGVQAYFKADGEGDWHGIGCPYGQPGDRLWVRETWGFEKRTEDNPGLELVVTYRADDAAHLFPVNRWRPSIHMPRHLSRITLEVTGVRVERLQDISEADTVAEGIPAGEVSPPDAGRFAYRLLWDDINGPHSWPANLWVWVIEFRRITP